MKNKKEKKGSSNFKKPKVQLKKISSRTLVKQLASTQGPLVREVPEREYSEDNRSLFFREEWKKAQGGKWI